MAGIRDIELEDALADDEGGKISMNGQLFEAGPEEISVGPLRIPLSKNAQLNPVSCEFGRSKSRGLPIKSLWGDAGHPTIAARSPRLTDTAQKTRQPGSCQKRL